MRPDLRHTFQENTPATTSGRNTLAILARSFDSEQIPTLGLIQDGDPLATILEISEDRKVDVIAMNTRDAGFPSNDAMSPLTESVLKSATVPVPLTRAR
jgi:nucleotide-binding universal stress UspA family protein